MDVKLAREIRSEITNEAVLLPDLAVSQPSRIADGRDRVVHPWSPDADQGRSVRPSRSDSIAPRLRRSLKEQDAEYLLQEAEDKRPPK